MKDRRGTTGQEITPEGKKWECCAACNGLGKVLVDDIPEVKRYVVMSPGVLVRGFCFLWGGRWEGVLMLGSPEEKRRPGNNPFGPRGTLRCLACQRRKKKVSPSPHVHSSQFFAVFAVFALVMKFRRLIKV